MSRVTCITNIRMGMEESLVLSIVLDEGHDLIRNDTHLAF